MSGPRHYDQDKDSTLYIGNLDERCTDSLVWELMLQAGPIVNVHLPKDRVTQSHQGYGFVEFATEQDADYAAQITNQIRLWGKPIRVNKASADKRNGPGGAGGAGGAGDGSGGVGADLFIGSLDPMVDEKALFDTFSRFGPLVSPPKIARDDATNLSKGYGFVSYASFDAADDAIANMHGQFMGGREVTVQFAYKKDGKGERHGDTAERALAAQAVKHGVAVQIPAMPASLTQPTQSLAPPPSAPAAMGGGGGGMGGYATPQPPPSYNYAPYAQAQGPPGGYNIPPQAAPAPYAPNGNFPPANRPAYNPQQSLQAPPTAAGLPARPPPSMAGYGGPPAGFAPPSMPMGAPPGMPMGGPPAGFRPPPPPGGQQQQPNGYQQQR